MYFRVPSRTSWSTQRLSACAWTSPGRRNILSKYQRYLLQEKGINKFLPNLVPNLRSETNCIIDYCSLKLCLELGLRLTNVHGVLLFDQSPWLKNYISFNTCQCTAAENDSEKDFFKLMNNAVFGKSFICLFVLLYWFIHCR